MFAEESQWFLTTFTQDNRYWMMQCRQSDAPSKYILVQIDKFVDIGLNNAQCYTSVPTEKI